ncbi:hypothetical protein [Myroides sp. DF42-4-2]|uniref:hypothetical protein n=1 Tax=unclassified Myroides TaxID=2642485 RepID=UPI00257858EC|nr:hypothetical protein [Myroides sp. DF42-4-2]MDM1407070.1 hypothetical protein [Myroides sp. DF42-4-2]
MLKRLFLVVCLFPMISVAQKGIGVEINSTPQEYVEHIVATWGVDKDKIVYITDETSLFKLSRSIQGSLLSFTQGPLSTSADILNGKVTEAGKRKKSTCGLSLNNLDIDHIKKYLKKGKNYQKLTLKRMSDNSAYEIREDLTTVLMYSQKLDYVIGEYFQIIKQLEAEDVDYMILCFDDEITRQIPGALSNN